VKFLKFPPHKQERAIVTREELIRAARAVFARDGFESARIECIAAEAGKTRGAFYANFRDKEDVFFAIYEEDVARDKKKISDALPSTPSYDDRVEVLARHLGELLLDRQRLLLNLEFKMYVIRHPRKRKRLAALYAEMCLRCAMTKINILLPELAGAEVRLRRSLTTEVGVMMDGLALNTMFDPQSLPDSQRQRYLHMVAAEAMRSIDKI
jgi:AcrR family transcriptional regulator